MSEHHFDFEMLTQADHEIAMSYLGSERQPDMTIAPDRRPYIHRWYIKPRDVTGATGNVYFHCQVADDPERPLHDHPWDNCSVILAGGYIETLASPGQGPWVTDPTRYIQIKERRTGDVIFRRAEDAHHLRLLPGEPYTLTQFTTGPYRRQWGFYAPDGWVSFDDFIQPAPHHAL